MPTTEEIRLADGTQVTLRPIRADDKQALLQAFARLSTTSRYQRFHSYKQTLTEDDLRYLTEVDGNDHFALVAVTPSHDLREDIGIGVARFVRSATEPDLAEAAITIADDQQGKGLGKLLLRRLVEAARERNIRRFQAEVLAENGPMVHLLRDAGAKIVRNDGTTLLLEVPSLEGEVPDADEAAWPLFRVLRTFAATVSSLVARATPSWGAAAHPTEIEELVIGIDLGGTKTEAVMARRRGVHDLTVLVRKRIPTDTAGGYEGVLRTVEGLIAEIAGEGELPAATVPIGIGMPGGVSRKGGLVKNSNTTCLNGRPFRADLEARLGRPVAFDNDANCFTLAEARLGAAAPYIGGVVFGVILGTGVGGGIAVRGELWPGAQGIAGEWGHHAVWPERERRCYCGQRGCVELYASGPAIERAYAESAQTHLLVPEIAARRSTDPHAERALEDFLATFGRALANVIDVLDPSAVVLGGGLSNLDFVYTEGAARIARCVFNDGLDTPILKNALGDSAGVLGAALIARA